MELKSDLRRTDLALELREDLEDNKEEDIEGIRVITKINKDCDIKETTIIIETDAGAKRLGKPKGTYITLESEELRQSDEDFHKPMSKALLSHLKALTKDCNKIMVVGLGNREVTPDALGPFVIDNLYITRHLIKEGIIDNGMEISAIAPGVMAQTGMETSDIVKHLKTVVKPDAILVIDALAARESGRLNKTIQISDTGITPGSGVGNHRHAIDEKTMKTKVIAIGVPTVIAVPTIVLDSLDVFLNTIKDTVAKKVFDSFNDKERYELASEIVEPYLKDMYVTPKNVDEAVKRISYTLSEAINGLNAANSN